MVANFTSDVRLLGVLGDLRVLIIGLVLFAILMLGFFGDEELASTPPNLSWRALRPELFWAVSEEVDREEIFLELSEELFVLKS